LKDILKYQYKGSRCFEIVKGSKGVGGETVKRRGLLYTIKAPKK
jgi:hypothetical protein